jgi:microsomal dipeptidase-like Zn-dependent dipeptidase
MAVVDAHTHATGFLPKPVAAAYRLVTHPHPHDVPFGALAGCGVDAIVAKAVGDGVVTRWHWPASPWESVERQLASIRAQADAGGCRLTTDPHAVGGDRQPAIVLGVEGADMIGTEPERLADLHALGVRVIGLVHYADNPLGTVCLPWQGWVPGLARLPLGFLRREPGLSPLGAEVVAEMGRLGIVVDLAHADRATTLAACAAATGPVLSSHTGARALQEFARFVSDDEARAIAATGGLLGLWPFHYRGRGVRDLDDWARHAGYLAELIGPDHLCIGTDMNGVSGLMHGYRGEEDVPVLIDALRATGFSNAEVAGIAGDNVLGLLKAVCG